MKVCKHREKMFMCGQCVYMYSVLFKFEYTI